MLDTLRQGANSWITKVFLGLLVMSFAIWGIADSFTPSSKGTVAKVGETEISSQVLEQEIDNEIRRLSQQTGQALTKTEAAQIGIPSQVMARLVALATLDEGARQMGLSVGDDAVMHDIVNDPQLRGAGGHFDPSSFRMALQRAGVDEKGFIASRRETLLRKQYADTLTAGVTASAATVDAVWTYQTETRSVDYFLLTPDAAGTIAEPDAKTVESFYKQASARFMEPERRSFTLMVLNPSDLAASMSISDSDLKAAYEQRRAEFDIPEKRTVEQIPFPTLEAAKAASEKLKKGEDQENILKELGLKKKDVELGSITRARMLSPALGEAAFALKKGEYSDPVQGPVVPVVLHVTEIEAGKTSTFNEVKDKLGAKMAQERAQEQVYDVQNSIEDSRAGGMALEDIAEKNSLKAQRFKDVSREGNKDIPEIKDLLEAVFRTEAGDHTPPSDSGQGGYYWVRVDEMKPAVLKPLDKVQPEVISLWKEEMRRTELQSLAQKLVERGNKSESIGDLAKSVNAKVQTSPQLKRNADDKLFSRNANTQLFSAREGGFASGPAQAGDDIIIMRVAKIEQQIPDFTSKEYKDLRARLADTLQNDLFVTYVNRLQKDVGVEVNNKLLQRILNPEAAPQ